MKERGPDGVPMDVPSRWKGQKEGGSLFGMAKGDEPPTVAHGRQGSSGASAGRASGAGGRNPLAPEPATRVASSKEEKKTGIWRGGQAKAAEGAEANLDDPVVGWLVVIDGPGKGSYVKIGHGQNSIGRDRQRITLDFGDSQISRENHATLTYDPKNKGFFIQQGTGTNLAYVNDQPVLSPTALEAWSRIVLGGTTLMFVPLCGEKFSWES